MYSREVVVILTIYCYTHGYTADIYILLVRVLPYARRLWRYYKWEREGEAHQIRLQVNPSDNRQEKYLLEAPFRIPLVMIPMSTVRSVLQTYVRMSNHVTVSSYFTEGILRAGYLLDNPKLTGWLLATFKYPCNIFFFWSPTKSRGQRRSIGVYNNQWDIFQTWDAARQGLNRWPPYVPSALQQPSDNTSTGVSHPSANRVQHCFTSVITWELTCPFIKIMDTSGAQAKHELIM